MALACWQNSAFMDSCQLIDRPAKSTDFRKNSVNTRELSLSDEKKPQLRTVVNADLKLTHFFLNCRFKADTPPLHLHTTYALGAVSRLLFTIPAAR